MTTNENLLRAILATVGRQTFPPSELIDLVSTKAERDKQVSVYNLCDGNTPQSEIGKKTSIDKGNLSRLISRWIDVGIAFRVGPDQHPLHLYQIPKEYLNAKKK